jgi:hypothetical protein
MKKQFKEKLSTAVFTSKYVMEKSSPIVYIAHNEDGSWEFWGKEIIDESEIMVVSLEQIMKTDPTIVDVADLPIQFTAVREDKDKAWQILSNN